MIGNQTDGSESSDTEMPGNSSSSNNIFNHGGVADEGMVTDDSNEMKEDENQSSTSNAINSTTNSQNDVSSAATTRGPLPWLLVPVMITVCGL